MAATLEVVEARQAWGEIAQAISWTQRKWATKRVRLDLGSVAIIVS
jgi:hypothetical protein